jgi:N-acetyl-1-D-myo-inositol-2-amino-2-deoxy-alpha-D-glucopyranoside deacetylase
MDERKTLLFVGAHPDDETFSIGATLAQYAAAGVKVYYACATRGEAGTVEPEKMKGFATIGEMRWAELTCAAKVLGLTDIIYLGYRDSGMTGSEDNKHPEALVQAPVEQVAGRIVKVIRELKPQVIITSDPIGGYRHPDHIAVHNATVKAFSAAADPQQYRETGPVFTPQKLYFSIFPRTIFRVLVKLMPLFGQDPHHFGRNKDVDIAEMANVTFPVHAIIRLTRQAKETREMAILCHASQMGGRPRNNLFSFAEKFRRHNDLYMRFYPPVTNRKRESDLFEGIV